MMKFKDHRETEIYKGRRPTVRCSNMFWLLSEVRKLMVVARSHAEDGDQIKVTVEIVAKKNSDTVKR